MDERGTFILLHGDIGAGKDTTGEYLVKKYGYTRIAYADYLKDQVAQLYKIDRDDMDSTEGKFKPLPQYPAVMTGKFSRNLVKEIFRYLRTCDGKKVDHITEIGTDRFDHKLYISDQLNPQHMDILYHTPRSILILEGCLKLSVDPNFWVSKAYEKLPNKGTLKIVVTDFRFPEEYYFTTDKYNGRVLVWSILIRNSEQNNENNDVSQSSLSSFSFNGIIENNKKSLEDLYSKVDTFMKMLASSGY